MGSIKYQCKLVVKDKMVIISLLLPIIMAILVNVLISSDLSSAIEIRFGVIKNEVPKQDIDKLEQYGIVTTYNTLESLKSSIDDPSTEEMGIVYEDNRIEVLISGDETTLTKSIASQMEGLLKAKYEFSLPKLDIIERKNIFQGFKFPLIALTLITAIYMGCVFNTINMVTEKEDGVKIIYDILPLKEYQYLMQKVILGFVGGILTSLITLCILQPPSFLAAVLDLAIVILSAYIAAVMGLFIGQLADNTLIAIVYLK